LHELGYNIFNIGKLTYSETNYLVDAWNEKQAREKREMEKSKNKR